MATLGKLLLCVFCVVYFLAVFYSITIVLSYFSPLDTAALAF
jgi:hypothetical protein